MKAYLFSYGTLQEDHIQLMLFGQILNTQVDSLSGYVTLNDFFGYPRLVEIPLVDRYESEAYERKEIETDKGRKVYVYFPSQKLINQ
jgi:hypothetical protein